MKVKVLHSAPYTPFHKGYFPQEQESVANSETKLAPQKGWSQEEEFSLHMNTSCPEIFQGFLSVRDNEDPGNF